MASKKTTLTAATVAQHELEFEMRATPARVWKALIAEMDAWWLPDFRMSPGSRRVVLEPTVGGRWYEDAGDGGLLWGHVIAIDPGKSIHLAGHIAPPWGASQFLMQFAVEPAARHTLLRISHAMFGLVTEEASTCTADGWRRLFGEGLKAHVER
ncbi:MAG: SRPBCC family protein [Phycisphaerae bacterium]